MAQKIETNETYCKYFFAKIDNDPEHHWQCQLCPKKRACTTGAGWSNLVGHLSNDHPTYRDDYRMAKGQSDASGEPMLKYLKRRVSLKAAESIYDWIDWIVSDNLSFEFVESDRTRANTKLRSISVTTLKKYMKLLWAKLKGKVEQILKRTKRFGIKTDGWTVDDEHFLALFASFVEETKGKQPEVRDILLSCSVQADIDVENAEEFDPLFTDDERLFGLTAADLFDHMMQTLVGEYHLDVNADNVATVVQFMGGDNCAVNRRLCNDAGFPLAGCQSHRLQLAVTDLLGPEEKKVDGVVRQQASHEQAVLRKLDLLMGELSTIKNAAILRGGFEEDEQSLKPERRCKAKWASLFKMLLKWEKLRVHIARLDGVFPPTVTNKVPVASVFYYLVLSMTASLNSPNSLLCFADSYCGRKSCA